MKKPGHLQLGQQVYPYKKEYPSLLTAYITQANEAIRANKHHDHRRALFIDFLRKAYDVDPTEIEIEEKIKVAALRGYIDALYKYLIFEFKTNLEGELKAAELELQKYFESQVAPGEYLAVVTDGLNFILYQYEHENVTAISRFVLSESDVIASFRVFDDLLFASRKTTPKSIDITTRFGPNSAVFNKARGILEELYQHVSLNPSVKVKFTEWNSLLSKVYGEPVGDLRLFLKHTYLTMFSRLLVLNALFPDTKKSANLYKGLLTGDFFAKHNLLNMAERDFFSWALDTEIEDHFVGLLAKVDKYLSPFKLDNIDEDILKEIYQELVDPESRHSLGEYYTPDWIADIALSALKYRKGTILDPACGSGTFLLAVIRRLRKMGLTGGKLVNKTLESVLGIDVHPLAVIMTKANLLLGLAKEIRKLGADVYLPVYMSDSLMTSENKKTKAVAIEVANGDGFAIPISIIGKKLNADAMIDDLCLSCRKAATDDKDRDAALKGFLKRYRDNISESDEWLWRKNFNLLVNLIRDNRDTIWAFILKNAYRPAFIRLRKVDYVVGNPPWLAYRYIKDINYKKRVKQLTLEYKLLNPEDGKLFTQMDTSTLFFVHSVREFLKKNGKIAFVLPKTVILPAKQHRNFQEKGFSEVHDFTGVTPLFNVRSVLIIKDPNSVVINNIPTTLYNGVLPLKNMRWDSAKKIIARRKTEQTLLISGTPISYYYPLFLQGATIVPRCFWFVQKDKDAAMHKEHLYLETGEEAMKESKEQWKMKMSGKVEKRFIFQTVLAKGIMPFAVSRVEPLFLPLIRQRHSFFVADAAVLMENGYQSAANWMGKVEELWNKYRKSDDRSMAQWLNYNQKLSKQNIDAPYVVLYNTSGTNISAALYINDAHPNQQFKSHGFIADAKTYYYYPKSIEEGFYLVAVLNSDIVNLAIKEYQPQGLYGERDIHRRPFEVCNISRFDPSNKVHTQLAELGAKSHDEIKPFIPNLQGSLGRVRTEVRKILAANMSKINKLVEKLLAESGQDADVLLSKSRFVKNGDLFI